MTECFVRKLIHLCKAFQCGERKRKCYNDKPDAANRQAPIPLTARSSNRVQNKPALALHTINVLHCELKIGWLDTLDSA